MSLTSALITASTSLRNTQANIDLISNNVANASTEGYTRKTAQQRTQVVDGQARAPLLSVPSRSVDQGVMRQMRQENSASGAATIKEHFLSRLEDLYGTPEAETALPHRIGALQDALTALTAAPDSSERQMAALDAASGIASTLTSTSKQIVTLRRETDQKIRDEVETVNEYLRQFQNLDAQVATRTALGQSSADLEDQRDLVMNKLSGIMDISYFQKENGSIVLSTGTGRTLVDSTVFPLEYNGASIGEGSSYPADIPGINLAGYDITKDFRSGSLKGLVDLRDEILPQAQAQLDELAGTLIDSFADAGLTLFADPANPTFDIATDAVGVAGRIKVSDTVKAEPWRLREGDAPAAESGNKGDTTQLQAVVRSVFESAKTFRTAGLGGSAALGSGLNASGTLGNYANSILTFQSTQTANIAQEKTFRETTSGSLLERHMNASGVNVDTELTNLIGLQNAYAASAKVVSTLNQLFDDLLNMV